MLKKVIIGYLGILFFYACNRDDKKQIKAVTNTVKTTKSLTSKQDSLTSAPIKEVVYFNYSNTEIKEEFRDSIFTKFSNLALDDKFTFYVPKGNINRTKSVLRIYNDLGELIYEKSFQTYNLINGYDLQDIKTDEELEKYILDKARDILANNSFVDITNKEEIIKQDGILNQPEDRFENYKVFTECQNDRRPLFCIGLAEEDITFIGYSRRLKKVIDLIYCC